MPTKICLAFGCFWSLLLLTSSVSADRVFILSRLLAIQQPGNTHGIYLNGRWWRKRLRVALEIVDAWGARPYRLPVKRNVCCFVLFRRTRCVDRNFGGTGIRLDQIVLNQVLLDFFTADVGEHHAINLYARRKWLTTLLLHLPAERRVLDDVL